MTTVVNCRTAKFDVYIGRPSKWGNPFHIGLDGSREDVIRLFKYQIASNPEYIRDVRIELKDKILGCWCAPLPCHGDILAIIADSE